MDKKAQEKRNLIVVQDTETTEEIVEIKLNEEDPILQCSLEQDIKGNGSMIIVLKAKAEGMDEYVKTIDTKDKKDMDKKFKRLQNIVMKEMDKVQSPEQAIKELSKRMKKL